MCTQKHGETFLEFDDEYSLQGKFIKSFLKIIDFCFAKDGYRFQTTVGSSFYVFGIYFLNIILLNIVIAVVGDKYDEVMQVRKESELKLKA